MNDSTLQSFSGYRCWDPLVAAEAIQIDAASPAASTLLAVHHPAHITRVVRGRAEAGGTVTEEDVYDALLDPTQKLRIIPIVGDSGTGKSHLVQWLRARIQGRENARIVYLPRSGTSLRGLIELLITQLEKDDELDGASKLRAQLRNAFDSTEGRDLRSELRDAMARKLEEIAKEPAEGKEGRRRSGLAGQLAVLLRVPELEDFWLGTDGLIDRFLKGIDTETRSDEERREGFVFRIADLPQGDDIGPLNEFGKKGGAALRDLNSSQEIKQAAADLGSEALNRALPQVIGLIGEVTLSHVFRRTRELLLQRGEELVVLIEDLTKLQGMDRELMSILLDPVEEDGVQVLCSLRVAIAVTTGYLSRLDETFRTRADNSGSTFLLDAPYGQVEGAWTDSEVADFVSRYLNAARVGVVRLQNNYKKASPTERGSDQWIPNRCDDCPHASKCHDAFGEVKGRGLYPFNREALAVMARAVLKDDQFNPRGILGGVVFQTLVHHSDDLAQGAFPSRALEREFPDAAPLPGSTAIGASQYPDRDRREVLLRFWGGAPQEVVDLDLGIHEAFQLSEIGRPQEGDAAGTQSDDLEPDTSAHRHHSSSGDQSVETPVLPKPPVLPSAIDRWATGKSLERAEVARMQSLLYRAVLQLVPWATLGVQPEHPFFVGKRGKGMGIVLRPSSFHIKDGLGVAYDETKVVVDITRTDRDLLLYFDQADGSSVIGLGVGGYRYVQGWLEDVASQVVRAIEEAISVQADDSPFVALASRLCLGTAMSGSIESLDDRMKVAGVVLTNSTTTPHSDPTEWNRLLGDLTELHGELALQLVSFAESRQSGKAQTPAVYRAGRVAKAIDYFLTDWRLTRRIPQLPDDVGSSLRSPSVREFASATRDQNERSRQQLERLSELLGPRPWSTSDLCDGMEEAVRSAELVNAFPGSPDQAREVIQRLREHGVERFEGVLDQLVTSDASIGELVLSSASLQHQGLHTTLQLLNGLDSTLVAAFESAESALADTATGNESSAMDAAIVTAIELRDLLGTIQ